ncbi:MAG: DUF4145 domain-containing protein [Chloroflexota bacterium]|nr:DUF4145 domain-containing protein [Chloroflexota bacterium]
MVTYQVYINGKPKAPLFLGQRLCPNPGCRAHAFVVLDEGQQLVASYPAERIDFDTVDVPQAVVATLEEAIACHANDCYVAAAIMVRKTLEVICHDQGAGGTNLYKRIEALGQNVMLPHGYIEGLHDLRLLGNDGAHIEANTFDQIGEEEVRVGIDVAKDVIRAVYQHTSMMKRLAALKKPSTT